MYSTITSLSKLLAFSTVQENAHKCDPVSPLEFAFEADRYMGTWYNIQHSHGAAFQPDSADCTTALYSDLNAEAGTFKVYNSSTISFLPRYGVTGSASVAGLPSGQAIVSFFGQTSDEPNYKVLDTDYDNYSMVTDCREDSVYQLWILSRSPTLDEDILNMLTAKAHELLPSYDWSIVRKDKQGGNCKYADIAE